MIRFCGTEFETEQRAMIGVDSGSWARWIDSAGLGSSDVVSKIVVAETSSLNEEPIALE
jgi:hypothetical protein